MTMADMREVGAIFGTMLGMSFCNKQYELPWLNDEEMRQIEALSVKFMDRATDLFVHGEIDNKQYETMKNAYKLIQVSIEKRIIDNMAD